MTVPELTSAASACDPDRPAIERVLNGDPGAYAAVVERHEVSLRRLILGIVADRHLAEDVLQEVFFLGYRHLARFRGEARFGTWLYRVAVREAMRGQARWHRLCRTFFSLSELEARTLAGPDSRRGSDDLDEALSILNHLPRRPRAAFVLHVVEGKTHAQVAKLLGTRPGTVASWIHRARARLKTAVLDAPLARAAEPGGEVA